MESATAPLAQAAGIYTCSNDGQSMFREVGEELPPCSCGEGTWGLWVHHNFSDRELIPVIVGKGILQLTITNLLPEVGMELNLHSDLPPGQKYDGKYRITSVSDLRWQGKDYIHILVERIDDFDPKLMMHDMAGVMNC